MAISQPSYPITTANLVTHVGTYVDTKLDGLTIVSLTQAEYDALGTHDPNTLYIITA